MLLPEVAASNVSPCRAAGRGALRSAGAFKTQGEEEVTHAHI